MLIVCPNCATSYEIAEASLGPGGRTVRCARCKTTWFAGGAEPAPAPIGVIKPDKGVNAFVDGVIAEAEADAARPAASESPPAPPVPPASPTAAGDDFGAGAPQSAASAPQLPRAGEFTMPPADGDMPATIADAPSLVPPQEQAPLPEPDGGDVESFAARRARMHSKRKKARRSSRWTAIILVLFAVNVAIIGGRNEVVRYLPQTAPLFSAIGLGVNLRHLKFDNVRIAKETEDGVPILVVEGAIVSESAKPVEVPRLRFAARNAAGQEIYTWTMPPGKSVLAPGERFEFKSRLAAPPKDAKDVMVRFFTANDAMAGTK